ncbi:MAG: hypothetical protein KJZ68_04005 [Phycisphaerales bacterium]|nr:hypothetical protein [Phycisphaerales bacterium]
MALLVSLSWQQPTTPPVESPPTNLKSERAFEVYGFARRIDSVADDILFSTMRPSPDLQSTTEPQHGGFLFDGLIWGGEAGVSFQYVNFRSHPSLSKWEWFHRPRSDRHDFPIGTQFIGRCRELAWFGNGWDRMEIERSPYSAPNVGGLRTAETVFDFTCDPVKAFAKTYGDLVPIEPLPEAPAGYRHIRAIAAARDAQNNADISLWQVHAQPDGSEGEWMLIRKNLRIGNTWLIRIRFRGIASDDFRLPATPQDVPRIFVAFRPDQPLTYYDLTGQGDWSSSTETVRFQREDDAPAIDRNAFDSTALLVRLGLTALIAWFTFLGTGAPNRPQKQETGRRVLTQESSSSLSRLPPQACWPLRIPEAAGRSAAIRPSSTTCAAQPTVTPSHAPIARADPCACADGSTC